MELIPLLLKELDQESQITRKFLKIVPIDKFVWKPHQKSMTLKNLVTHIAELPAWIDMAINTDGIDFADFDYTPTPVNSSAELLELFEQSLAKGTNALNSAIGENLSDAWVLRNGNRILGTMTKYESVRHSFSQTIHHRAQLGVYLRLLNIPIPGTYGPSADDNNNF